MSASPEECRFASIGTVDTRSFVGLRGFYRISHIFYVLEDSETMFPRALRFLQSPLGVCLHWGLQESWIGFRSIFRIFAVCFVRQWPHVHAPVYGCSGTFTRFPCEVGLRRLSLTSALSACIPQLVVQCPVVACQRLALVDSGYVCIRLPGGLRTCLHDSPREGGLQILRLTLVVCEILGVFLAPCTQVQGRVSCPQGHGPQN